MKIYRNIFAGFAILLFASICFGQENLQQRTFFSFSEKNITVFNFDENDSLETRVLKKLRAKGFTDVSVKMEKGIIVLRGTVPKGKMAEAVQIAQEANGGKPVKVELTEK